MWAILMHVTCNHNKDPGFFYRRHDQYCKYVVKSFTWSTSPRNDLFHMEKHEVTQPRQKSHANTRCRRLNDVNGVFRICTMFCVRFFRQLNKDKYLFLRLLLLFLNQNKHTFYGWNGQKKTSKLIFTDSWTHVNPLLRLRRVIIILPNLLINVLSLRNTLLLNLSHPTILGNLLYLSRLNV